MIRRLHAYTSALPEFEGELLLKLEAPKQFDTATEIAQAIMQKLNGEPAPINRFDKTRRALRKKMPKGPRGVPKSPFPKGKQVDNTIPETRLTASESA